MIILTLVIMPQLIYSQQETATQAKDWLCP